MFNEFFLIKNIFIFCFLIKLVYNFSEKVLIISHDITFNSHVNHPYGTSVKDFKSGSGDTVVNAKIANYFNPEFPADLWSIFHLDQKFAYLIILVMLLPLVSGLYIIFFSIKNIFNYLYRGNFFLLENKNKNFSLLTKALWDKLWIYSFDWVKRYGLDGFIGLHYKLPNRLEENYPNPKYVISTFKKFFLFKSKPKFFYLFLYVFFYMFFLVFFSKSVFISFLLAFMFIFYLEDRWYLFIRDLGLNIKWFTVSTHIKTKKNDYGFYEALTLRLEKNFIIVFFSFLLFFFVTLLVISLYIDFFFNPILTWNGYFSKTVYSFHFFFNPKSIHFYNLDYFFALDGLNIWLIWLTSMLVLLCSLFLYENVKNDTFFAQMGWIFLLEFASFQFFCVPNYFWMYIFFEMSLLPIFILIVFWGSNR